MSNSDKAKYDGPNYTQVPNKLIDDDLKHITSLAELKVVLTVIRKTFGWHEKEAEVGAGYLEQVTGMSRNAVRAGLALALHHNIIIRVRDHTFTDGAYYVLNIKDIEFQERLHKNFFQPPKQGGEGGGSEVDPLEGQELTLGEGQLLTPLKKGKKDKESTPSPQNGEWTDFSEQEKNAAIETSNSDFPFFGNEDVAGFLEELEKPMVDEDGLEIPPMPPFGWRPAEIEWWGREALGLGPTGNGYVAPAAEEEESETGEEWVAEPIPGALPGAKRGLLFPMSEDTREMLEETQPDLFADMPIMAPRQTEAQLKAGLRQALESAKPSSTPSADPELVIQFARGYDAQDKLTKQVLMGQLRQFMSEAVQRAASLAAPVLDAQTVANRIVEGRTKGYVNGKLKASKWNLTRYNGEPVGMGDVLEVLATFNTGNGAPTATNVWRIQRELEAFFAKIPPDVTPDVVPTGSALPTYEPMPEENKGEGLV